MTEIVTDNRARQGPRGRPVLMVLLGSLFLLGICTIGLMMWIGSDSQTVPNTAQAPASNPSARTLPSNPAYPVPTDPSATGTTRPATR